MKVYIKPNNTIVTNKYFVYKRNLILCREFLNDDNVEKLTTVGGKLLPSLLRIFATIFAGNRKDLYIAAIISGEARVFIVAISGG